MSARVGVNPFQDEDDSVASDELPRGQTWGKPCAKGHGAREGRTARRIANGDCVQCANDRRREAREAERTRKPNDLSRGVSKPFEKTNVVCALGAKCRKKNGRGNPGRLTRIAVAHGERYCSRQCAGLFAPTESGDDVSDEELAEVEVA